ncbi:MAG: LTA synthase family protein [Paludibacteraceae bacterium]|nr:LTA synthase family protein [Paludibacteraceae bacterium]
MKTRILFLLKYYLYWILFFVLQKPLFMVWQYGQLGEVGWRDWWLVPWHGLPLDMSVAAYIAMAAGVLLTISVWVRWEYMRRSINTLTGIVLFVALWVMLGDNGCFPHWGYHLDKSILLVFTSPQEVLANAEWWVWLAALTGFVMLFTVWWLIYKETIVHSANKHIYTQMAHTLTWKSNVASTMVLLLLTALLFLPLRGSVTVSTMNTGRVYFSDNPMLNQAAVNPLFNLIETLTTSEFDTDKYTYMSSLEAQEEVSELLPKHNVEQSDTISLSHTPALLTTSRPDIILFILESFSYNAWKAMPCVRQLACEEGVLFDNVYASSYRTDRGIVAVLSGFPGQPTSSLMLHPAKAQRLPNIGLDLKKAGYDLHFWYGGDEDFTSMRSYLVSGGFDKRVSDKDFSLYERMSKWGVPDHILFSHVADSIASRLSPVSPTFDVVLSLSSHEPFDVPTRRFAEPYLNSIAYTDSCLGVFANQLKQSHKWDNTLVVMVADHGFPYPEGISRFDTLRYKIPIVLTGGAVKEPVTVHTLCSQIDLVPTLLTQLHLPTDAYRFGKDILCPTIVPFAFYSFNDGFALITDDGATVIDAAVDKPVMERNPKPERERQARAFIQRIMETIEQL